MHYNKIFGTSLMMKCVMMMTISIGSAECYMAKLILFYFFSGRDVIHLSSASAYQENVLDLGGVVVAVEFSGGHPPLMGHIVSSTPQASLDVSPIITRHPRLRKALRG